MEKLLQMEESILIWIQENLRSEVMTVIMRCITKLGNYSILWLALAVVFLMYKNTRQVGVTTLVAIGLNTVVTNLIIKNVVERTRPYEVIEGLNILIEKQSDFSFPSGHSSHAFAAGVVLFMMLPRKAGVPILVLSGLIAFSRLYLGVHYPSDVIAGCLIGAVIGILSVVIVKFYLKKRKEYIDSLES